VFSAIGYTSDNLVLHSAQISRVLLTSEDAWAETRQMIIPILGVVGVVTLIGLVVPFLLGRKKDFKIGAEARFRAADSPLPVESPSEESLNRLLEESRFEE